MSNVIILGLKGLNISLKCLQHVKLDKSQIKLTKVKEEAEKEQMEMLRLKEAEIQQLRERLEAQMQDMSKQELQMQAHKEYLEKQNALLETLKVLIILSYCLLFISVSFFLF